LTPVANMGYSGSMTTTPEIVERPAQPYVAIARWVTMVELGDELPPLIADVFGWLGAHGYEPVGPPFWKYNVIDMERELNVEVGVPIAAAVDGDDRVRAGVVPAGRYVTVVHTGSYAGLEDATRELLEWADGQGLTWDVTTADDGEHWTARLEEYLTDPAQEPDQTKWQTRLAFRLA
jgi:effector-binding domain-containing protein